MLEQEMALMIPDDEEVLGVAKAFSGPFECLQKYTKKPA
ncbi:MAG: hypothetical protein ACJATW_000284 [Glaciecola sp.]|jgi:hypothetical protein